MLRPALAILVFNLTLAFVPGTSRGQDEGASADGDEAPKTYVAPSASKSVEIGNFYLRKKKLNAALSRFEEAVKTDPYYAPGYLGLGKVYEKIGLKQKALKAYQNYLDTLPSAKDAADAKEVHEAMARLERALKPAHALRPGAPAPAHPPAKSN